MSPYELLTVCLSSLAFVLSLYSAISTYYEKHIKTQIYVRWTSYFGHQLNVSLMLSNMSSRPSSLTNVVLHYGKNSKESSLHHAKLTVEESNNTSWSDITPINIPSRSAVNIILCFQHLDGFEYKDKIDLSYMIDGHEIKKSENLTNKLTSQQLVIALDYRTKHNI